MCGGDEDPWLIADGDLVVHDEELGRGCTGVVFAGSLCSSQDVAVKLVLGRLPGVDQSEAAQAHADMRQVGPGHILNSDACHRPAADGVAVLASVCLPVLGAVAFGVKPTLNPWSGLDRKSWSASACLSIQTCLFSSGTR